METEQGVQGEFPVTAIEARRVWKPGIFKVWRPERIEKILPESWRLDPNRFEELQDLADKGITPVFVPDDDPDHRGNVYGDAQTTRAREEEG